MKKNKHGSNFKKKKNDFYQTVDPAAPLALHNVLEPQTKYTEPCVGCGALVYGLSEYGHRCVHAYDLIMRKKTPQYARQLDAFDLTEKHVRKSDFIITNPPFTRSILHPMIENFISLRPTWLLFEADWAHTGQSIPYMPYCKKIVSVGRLRWFKNTKGKSTKDFSWYLFTDRKSKSITFVPRQ